jgi:DNA-binding MarR family transcriptional regulator
VDKDATMDPPPTSPAFLIMSLGRRLREDVERALAPHGISLRHLSVLGHLAREPGLSYSELARRAGITAQSMQATLRHLEDLGAVERRTAPGRGRSAKLHITDRGAALQADGQRVITAADQRLLADLPADQRNTLGRLLLHVFRAAASPPGGDIVPDTRPARANGSAARRGRASRPGREGR